ncbi:MAG: cell division protein FtsL [Acidobacteriaceae bacterium]|nr:cell division protein FtsL [Acidobacteriaceae bacterium]MBV9779540.1 cell division protein FtsL [Acidobacteriaceae bacterium]
MASLASLVNRFVAVSELADVRPAVWTRADSCRLRPIANEDVFLFVKRIDNSSVIRAADPLARRARTRSVTTGFAAAMLVIAGLMPAAYNTMTGFSVQTLKQEQQKLQQERAALDLEEAKLLNPARLAQLAKSLKMVEPVAQQVQYLDSKTKADARNRLPAAVEASPQ